VVPSAEEALLESSRLTVDLLVTDLRLPGMTGAELIRKIRVRQPGVRVILMTGISDDDRLAKQRDEAKADVFLRKPISAGNFLETVERLLELTAEPPAPPEPPAANAKGDGEEAVLRELSAVLPGEPVPAKARTGSLRKVTGGLSLPVEPQPSSGVETLSGILSHLRGSLGALSVVLLDDRGHPVAQAGELPDPAFEEQLVPPLMAALSASARVSYLLGQERPQSVQAYRGVGVDVIAAPAGQYALLALLRPGRSALRLALAFEEALNAQIEVEAALQSMGLRLVSTVEVAAPETLLAEMSAEEAGAASSTQETGEAAPAQEAGLEMFEALFNGEQAAKPAAFDPDAFWDQAASGERDNVAPPGVLSFDQAQKLGLVPDEDADAPAK
jgi:CheY-like chemotaxis protein